MENLKVRVNSVEESKEVQELFFELGCYWQGGNREDKVIDVPSGRYIFSRRGVMTHCDSSEVEINGVGSSLKEIALPELKDMVILNRNDPKDANVIDPEWGYVKLYLSSDNNLYYYGCESERWQESNMNGIPKVMERLKPITKEKTFKEYLQKLDDGTYRLVELDNVADGHEGLIEVPEGAESYSTDSMLGNKIIKFFKPGFIFLDGMWMRCNFQHTDADILWQRHTQPEELPFIDDEPIIYKNSCVVGWSSEAKKQSSVETETGKHLDITAAFIGYKCRRQGESDDSYRKRLLDLCYPRSKIPLQPKTDNVNHPSHYTNGKVECIDALESATVGKSGIEAVCTANIIKYLWRYEDKNGLEDVEKAQWYLNKLLDVLKNK